MVNYLPQTATTTITVLTAEVGTTLTIWAPAEVIQGQPFLIEGQLKRADTGALLAGEEISISYNGTHLVTTPTRSIEGTIKYQAAVQIDEVGLFTLTASFAGSTRPGLVLGPSKAPRGVGVSLLPAQVILALLAASLGLGLVVASRT